MKLKVQRRGPTHEDALQAKIRALLEGLTAIAWYGECEADRATAHAAIVEASAQYKAGVLRAVD